MRAVIFFLLLFYIIQSQAQTQDLNLTFDISQHEFDSHDCCWRELADRKYYKEAAALIITFIETPNAERKQPLYWHAGQMLASAGDYDKASGYFKRTYNVFYKWFGGDDGRAWYYYVKGTAAFADRNKEKLQRMVRKWEKNLPKEGNFNELEKLLTHWDKTYSEAYTAK